MDSTLSSVLRWRRTWKSTGGSTPAWMLVTETCRPFVSMARLCPPDESGNMP